MWEATSSTATTVTLDSGQTATCTITNDDIAASLSLDKVVTNNNGGTAVEADWTLTATPQRDRGSGPGERCGWRGATDVLPGPTPCPSRLVRPATRRARGAVWGRRRPPATTVTVALGETVTCTINNDDVAASLSLDKVVTNNNGGTAVEADWTLTATPRRDRGSGPGDRRGWRGAD